VRAREILKRIDSAGTLLRMRIDRRFDELVRREPKAFDVAAAAENQCRQLHGVIDANPRKLGPIVQYMYALLTVARYQELLTLADRTLSRQAQAPKDKPAFDDVADKLNWIYDLKSQGLRGLGRWDEALAIQEAARGQRDSSTDKVSQAINLGSSYINRDRPNDALKSLEDIDWVHSLSGYGRMQLQHVRFRAYLQLGDREEAEKVFVYLRQNKIDAEDTWQDAMLEWGDVDGAAAQYIARLHDPEQRIEALYAAQTFKPVPRLPRETEYNTRWQALLDRADVTAAINEVGRREQHPIYDLWN
jgi:tetratricopeptide (TPR) repeat protein